jgi:hypothetical protein
MENLSSDVKAAESPRLVTFDAIMPAAMAARAEESGVKRVSTDLLTLLGSRTPSGPAVQPDCVNRPDT